MRNFVKLQSGAVMQKDDRLIDEEENRHILLEDIIDHRQSNSAIDKDGTFIMMKNGVKRRRKTTQGWYMLCQWKDGSTNWVALKS